MSNVGSVNSGKLTPLECWELTVPGVLGGKFGDGVVRGGSFEGGGGGGAGGGDAFGSRGRCGGGGGGVGTAGELKLTVMLKVALGLACCAGPSNEPIVAIAAAASTGPSWLKGLP